MILLINRLSRHGKDLLQFRPSVRGVPQGRPGHGLFIFAVLLGAAFEAFVTGGLLGIDRAWAVLNTWVLLASTLILFFPLGLRIVGAAAWALLMPLRVAVAWAAINLEMLPISFLGLIAAAWFVGALVHALKLMHVERAR